MCGTDIFLAILAILFPPVAGKSSNEQPRRRNRAQAPTFTSSAHPPHSSRAPKISTSLSSQD